LIQDELRMEVQERPVDRTELYLADEMFFCGTGAQISAITRIDYRSVGTGKIGRATSDVRQLYFDVVRGKVSKYRSWCYPVYDVQRATPSKESSHVTVK